MVNYAKGSWVRCEMLMGKICLFPCCAVKSVALAAGCKAQSKVQKGKLLTLAFVERVSILRIVAESQGNNISALKIRRRGTSSKSLWSVLNLRSNLKIQGRTMGHPVKQESPAFKPGSVKSLLSRNEHIGLCIP